MKKPKKPKPGHKSQKPQTFTKRKWFPKERRSPPPLDFGMAMGIGAAAEMSAMVSIMFQANPNRRE